MPSVRIKGRKLAATKLSLFAYTRARVRAWLSNKRLRWNAWRDVHHETLELRTHYRLQRDAIAVVAKILETEWDNTGYRLVGVPRSEFVYFASVLVGDIECKASPRRLAERLAFFEAELGLRDSPSEHRLGLGTRIREAVKASA